VCKERERDEEREALALAPQLPPAFLFFLNSNLVHRYPHPSLPPLSQTLFFFFLICTWLDLIIYRSSSGPRDSFPNFKLIRKSPDRIHSILQGGDGRSASLSYVGSKLQLDLIPLSLEAQT
jgi:hypothetical protein